MLTEPNPASLFAAPNLQPRRIAAAIAMLAGAGLGAALVLRVGIGGGLVVTWLVIAANGLVAWRLASSSEAWTMGR